jgi:acetoin utilization deacetylase AcuC-like enzyme
MEEVIFPALRNFRPDILFLSAGFDAHRDDPLANLRLTEPDFAWATRKLADIADTLTQGRLVSMLEGGYNLAALAKSVGVHVNALMEAAS